MYVQGLAAPDTINTIPEKTILAFVDHGEVNDVMPKDGGASLTPKQLDDLVAFLAQGK